MSKPREVSKNFEGESEEGGEEGGEEGEEGGEEEWGFAEGEVQIKPPTEHDWEDDNEEKKRKERKKEETSKPLTLREMKSLTQEIKRTIPEKLTLYPSNIMGTMLSYFPRQSQLERIDYIVGPITLSEHYNPILGKIVYVFGDKHVIEVKCPPKATTLNSTRIDLFLEKLLLENPDKIVDLFLEIEYHETKSTDNFIQIIQDNFLPCFYANKNCPFPNLRAHWTDFRHTEYVYGVKSGELTIGNLCEASTGLLHAYSRNNSREKEHFRQELFRLMEILPKNAWDPAKVVENPVIRKQINSIKDPNIQGYLLTSFLERSTIAADRLWSLQKSNSKDYPAIVFESVELCVAIMDLYLMARLFRNFKTVEGKYSKSPENIVIYAGDYHANYYRSALEQLGFKTRRSIASKTDGNDFQCLNVKEFYPWFNRD